MSSPSTYRYVCPHGCGHLDVTDHIDLSARHSGSAAHNSVTVTSSFSHSDPPCDHLRELLGELKESQKAMLRNMAGTIGHIEQEAAQ